VTVRQLVGDCRVQLATLEAGSVQCCITSPPYWGLRDYGTPPLVWGGDPEHAHAFGPMRMACDVGRRDTARRTTGHGVFDPVPSDPHVAAETGSFCACGAWLGSLGLEPTPDLCVEHIVECFRHVRRVLRDDGTLWVNLGDSYAGSGNGAHDYRERAQSKSLSLNSGKYQGQSPAALQRVRPQEHTEGNGRVQGYKPKDLLMIPFRVAMALQADGWWLRSVIPWLKRNSMPESVTDRPSTACEYVFLLSKSSRYYFDADAVRSEYCPSSTERSRYAIDDIRTSVAGQYRDQMQRHVSKNGVPTREHPGQHPNGRNRRNSDWFFESWQGLMLDEQDEPLALVVNPQPFKESHFATFPPKLVEPMVRASTRPGDVVLDPFAGAGTTLLVADRLGRNAIGCELKPEYSAMAVNRLTGDAPMFVEMGEAPA
jgi:DNA modification methylase